MGNATTDMMLVITIARIETTSDRGGRTYPGSGHQVWRPSGFGNREDWPERSKGSPGKICPPWGWLAPWRVAGEGATADLARDWGPGGAAGGENRKKVLGFQAVAALWNTPATPLVMHDLLVAWIQFTGDSGYFIVAGRLWTA